MNNNPPPPLGINNGLGLPSGATPKIIPLQVDLTAIQAWTVDLTQQQQSNAIGPIQTIYINNSGNSASVTVEAMVSNISYTILPGDSAILPFFLPGTAPKFTVSSSGGVVIPIAVLDTPQPAQVWGASTGAGFNFTDGNLRVTDVALDALISNLGEGNGLGVYDLGLNSLITNQGAGLGLDVNVLSGGGGGGNYSGLLVEGQINAGTATLSSPASPSGKLWRVTGLHIVASYDIANTAAGSTFIRLISQATGTTLALFNLDYPATSGVTVGPPTILAELSYPEPLAGGGSGGDTLQVSCVTGSGQPTSGYIGVNVWGYAA